MGRNVKICKNLSISLVAATYSKAKTYVFARPRIRDREVGGSNPLAPTILFRKQTAASAAAFVSTSIFTQTKLIALDGCMLGAFAAKFAAD